MKIVIPFICVCFTVCCLSSGRLHAQQTQGDSLFYQSAINNAVEVYRQSFEGQTRLLNGKKYKRYPFEFVIGTPFFQPGAFTPGSIVYEGGYYNNVQLLYDQVKDMVIISTPNTIELISERIESFSIAGHFFERLVKDSLKSSMATGFYERLYHGKITMYKKEKKEVRENLSNIEGVKGEIDQKVFYYLCKEGNCYPVKKKAELYKVLSSHQPEIKKFVKANGLSFKHDIENTLIQVAGYYDQLTK